MPKFELTFLWLVFYALLIVPLQLKANYEKTIEDLQWRESWLRARFMDCVDAENPQRMYFPSGQYVEFKCVHIEDTTFVHIPKRKRKSHG